MSLENLTLRETVSNLITDYGFRDYLRQFYFLHKTEQDESGEVSEAAFVRRMTPKANPNQIELAKLYKRTNPMIRNCIRLLALIAPCEVDGVTLKRGATELKAFHESLFLTLFQTRYNLRRMFELAFDCEDDPEEFIEQLQDKFKIDDIEAEAFTTTWVDTFEKICQGLLDQNSRVVIFTDKDAMFRLVDEEDRSTIKVPSYMMTENQLIVSKDYFFVQILTVLKHVELLAKVSSLKTGKVYVDKEIPVTELIEMEAFYSIAEGFMDREAT